MIKLLLHERKIIFNLHKWKSSFEDRKLQSSTADHRGVILVETKMHE